VARHLASLNPKTGGVELHHSAGITPTLGAAWSTAVARLSQSSGGTGVVDARQVLVAPMPPSTVAAAPASGNFCPHG
jgi:hypothetical protein